MKRESIMLSLLALAIIAGCGGNVIEGVADKGTDDSCRYETTQNLDKGNYDAVLASSCADSMHKGAAYFGKAGYDIKDVINRFSEAEDEENDLNLYMTALTKIVTDNTLTNLDSAKTEYGTIQSASENYKDAQFYLSLVNAVKSLSLIKLVIDDDGNGQLNTTCDKNSNSVPDEVDATSCALLISAGQPCSSISGATVTGNVSPISIQDKSGAYKGLTITVAGAGTGTTCLADENEYKRLLFQSGLQWVAATTTSEICLESPPVPGREWPCPLEQNNVPLDLVVVIDESITSAIDSVGKALPGVTTDVQTSINDIKAQNCCKDAGENPLNVSTCTCSSPEISAYLQTL